MPANVKDIRDLLSGPGQAKRPKKIAVILRGLPGSGKSLIARRLRDAEVATGNAAPRIHSIDDYFVTVLIHHADRNEVIVLSESCL